MKRRALYLVLTVITAAIASFTRVAGNQSKQSTSIQTVQVTPAGVSVEYNDNGSVRQITWKESDSALYVKAFVYHNNAVTITEKLNNRLIKEETGELNNGMLTAIKGKLVANDGTAASYTMDYQYNDEGQTLHVLYGNGNRHDYVYDARKNLVETNWFNRQGDILVTAKKQYFPKLPDAYTVYHRMADNVYASFVPAFGNKMPAHTKMSNKVKVKVSFGGKYSYTMDTDGYLSSN
jgi:YD repeat-containing protein